MSNFLFNGGNIQPQNQQQINQGNYINTIFQMYKNAQNPQSLLESMAKQNPALQQVIEFCQGKDPKTVFYEACKQKNIDPEKFLSQFK